MIDLTDLSEQERWEYVWAQIKAGNAPRAGRPKKNGDTPKWSDFGLTRKEVWNWRRLGEIGAKDLDTFLKSPEWKKRRSHRSIFVRFGKINVPSENDFDGTPLGDLVRALLSPCERLLSAGDGPNKRERRLVKRALLARLQQIFRAAEPAEAKELREKRTGISIET